MSAQEKDRRGIQSIEVGGELLAALTRNGGAMTLGNLARDAGMTAAKAHPYLVSFGKLGLVAQDPAGGRYALGPFALQMGLTALRASEPLRTATPLAGALAEDLRLTVAMAVWGNFGPTIVRIDEGGGQLHVNMRPGSVMTPLMGSATGRLFAAFMPPGALVDMPTAAADLCETEKQAVLDETRRHGVARALGRPIPGVDAFSAPVFNCDGSLALALTALGAAGSFDSAWDGATAVKLKAAAAEASRRLGHRSD
jgi:DNA-binding IclR family transcriptional regulator